MLVGMAVRDQPAAPLGLREMVGRSWLNQRIGQDLLEGLARYIARRERAIERVSGVAADRLDTRRMKGILVDCSPGGRLFIARANPFLAKGLLAASKEAQIVGHAVAIMCDKARQSTVVVAVAMAEDQSVQPLGFDTKQREIAYQDLRRVAKIEQIMPCRATCP